jgi:hypothetical protein
MFTAGISTMAGKKQPMKTAISECPTTVMSMYVHGYLKLL